MNILPPTQRPPADFGLAAAVVGTIALLVFFMPVLGIPISASGLLFGVIGLAASWTSGGIKLRWGLAGIAVSALALALNIAIAFAPAGYLRGHEVPHLWQAVPDRPSVPPPGN
jgi:hypothetical protein